MSLMSSIRILSFSNSCIIEGIWLIRQRRILQINLERRSSLAEISDKSTF